MAKTQIARKILGETAVTFAFTNGRSVRIDLTDLPEAMIHRLALHGLSQKGGDSYAGAADKGWTIDEAADAVEAVRDGLMRGEWSQRGGTGTSLLVEALARVTGRDVAEVAGKVEAMDAQRRKQAEADPRVKAAIAAIRAERAKAAAADASGPDLGELFD